MAAHVDRLVVPAVAYGYKSQPKSGGCNHSPGTRSFGAGVFIGLVRNIAKELARHGVRKVVLVDSHMENLQFHVGAADLSLRDQPRLGVEDLRIVRFDYWELIYRETERILFPDEKPSWKLEHAAIMKTSLMLHLRPDLVRSGLIPDHPPAQFPVYEVFPFDTSSIPSDGALSSARPASAAKGKLVIEQIVPDIGEALRKAFRA